MKKNLILTAMSGYNYSDVALFMLSLREINFKGDIVIFVDGTIGKRTLFKLKELGAKLVFFKNEPPYVTNISEQNKLTFPSTPHIAVLRFYLCYDFLLKNQDIYANVLLTDIRDVYFQKDPFDFNIKPGLYLALENSKIKDNSLNKGWIHDIVGDTKLHTIEDNFVSCVGTTIGDIINITEYLCVLVTQICKLNQAWFGVDQATHNYIIYTGQVKNYEFAAHNKGPILTMGFVDDYNMNSTGQVRNSSGEVPNILHQYDRKKDLMKLFNTKHFGSPLSAVLNRISYKMFN